jgi:hypothetical protein
MSFAIKFSWEFIQNLPLVSGLMLALHHWQAGRAVPAVSAVITGSLLGAVLIRLTEDKIVGRNQAGLQGNREPVSVTVTNFVMMSLFMLALTIYLAAGWSGVVTDLIAGGLLGLLLSAGQSRAAGRPIGRRHTLAFAAAFPAALIAIRLFSAALPAVISVLLITTTVTLIITYIDYGHFSTIKEGAN